MTQRSAQHSSSHSLRSSHPSLSTQGAERVFYLNAAFGAFNLQQRTALLLQLTCYDSSCNQMWNMWTSDKQIN
eukprot:2366824-Pleurochrysis_carterae.AAC.1